MSSPTIEARLRARFERLREHLGRSLDGRGGEVLYSYEIPHGSGWSDFAGMTERHRAYELATRSWHRTGEARWRIDGARWPPGPWGFFHDTIATPPAEELDVIREQMNGDAGKIAEEIGRRLEARGSIGPEHLPLSLIHI